MIYTTEFDSKFSDPVAVAAHSLREYAPVFKARRLYLDLLIGIAGDTVRNFKSTVPATGVPQTIDS